MSISQCLLCKKNHVPEMILASIEPPSELKVVGEGRLIEAHGTISFCFNCFNFICKCVVKKRFE